MQVIASDSYSLRPKMVDTLVSTAGERFDFIITADQAEGKMKNILITFLC